MVDPDATSFDAMRGAGPRGPRLVRCSSSYPIKLTTETEISSNAFFRHRHPKGAIDRWPRYRRGPRPKRCLPVHGAAI